MIKSKIDIKDDRKEWDGMIRAIDRFKGASGNAVDIGVFGDKDSHEVIIAGANEFGAKINHPGGTPYGYKTQKDAEAGKVSFMGKGKGFMLLGTTQPHEIKIPERSFIRSTFDNEIGGIHQRVEKAKVQIVLGKLDKKRFLKLLGLFLQKKIVQRINASPKWAEPNAPATIAKKGSSHPLINKGRLRQSITHKLVE